MWMSFQPNTHIWSFKSTWNPSKSYEQAHGPLQTHAHGQAHQHAPSKSTTSTRTMTLWFTPQSLETVQWQARKDGSTTTVGRPEGWIGRMVVPRRNQLVQQYVTYWYSVHWLYPITSQPRLIASSWINPHITTDNCNNNDNNKRIQASLHTNCDHEH